MLGVLNWENHDIDFILIRFYECLRVLVNKFKYPIGVQMLTRRGVEHCGSKKYVEWMKKKFASSYKFKEILDKDHEDLVNLEGPHFIVPEHVTARELTRPDQGPEMVEDGPAPLPLPSNLCNFRDVTRYLSNAIMKTYKEKGGKKKQLRWGINDPTSEYRPYWWDEVEKLPHSLPWEEMPPPTHVSKETWPLKGHIEVGMFLRECVRIYLKASNVNPDQHSVQKVKRRTFVNRMRKRGHSMAHQDSSSSNSSGTSQVDQDNERNDDNEQQDEEDNDDNHNEDLVGHDDYEDFAAFVPNEDEEDNEDEGDNEETVSGRGVWSTHTQEYEEGGQDDEDRHRRDEDVDHSHGEGDCDQEPLNKEILTDSDENDQINNNSFEAEEANFELLDRTDSVSDDIPLVDLRQTYTQNDETLAFDSDEYPSSPENNVVEESAANPPLVPAQNFGRRPTPNQVQQKQTRKRRPPPEESPAQTRSRSKLNRLNDQ